MLVQCCCNGHDWEPIELQFTPLFGQGESSLCLDCGTLRNVVTPHRGETRRSYHYRTFYGCSS